MIYRPPTFSAYGGNVNAGAQVTYKLDSRQVRWGEYRRLAADPVTLLVLSFCKLCRIPFQLMKGLPLHDSQAVNLLAEGELPEFVGRRWQPDLDRLIALGCHSPQVYGVRDNLTLNIIMLVHPVNAIKTWQRAGQPQP